MDTETVICPCHISGQTTTNKEQIIEIVEQLYRELYREEDNNEDTKIKKVENVGSEDILEISEEKISNAIHEMKNNKASGEDQIVNEIVMAGRIISVKSLARLYTMRLSQGDTVQMGQSSNNNNNNGQKRDTTLLRNYRPVSLLSHFYKLFMKIILTD